MMTEKFIPLSVPNFSGNEKEYVNGAVVSEWVSTGGSLVGEFEQKVISEMQIAAFAEQSITEKDRKILKLRMDGLTEQEIADKVGYKTASAVHKRIAKIAGAYEDYVTAEYQKYLDK